MNKRNTEDNIVTAPEMSNSQAIRPKLFNFVDVGWKEYKDHGNRFSHVDTGVDLRMKVTCATIQLEMLNVW
jgi:hypothetical protein